MDATGSVGAKGSRQAGETHLVAMPVCVGSLECDEGTRGGMGRTLPSRDSHGRDPAFNSRGSEVSAAANIDDGIVGHPIPSEGSAGGDQQSDGERKDQHACKTQVAGLLVNG